MADVSVEIDSQLSILRSDLPPGIEKQISDYLTLENQDRFDPDDNPELVCLYGSRNGRLVMPRGFASVLSAGLKAHGHRACFKNRTDWSLISLADSLRMKQINLRPDQEQAVQTMLSSYQGIVEAPTGSGKSIIGLEAFRRSGTRCLVVTHLQNLAQQWRSEAKKHLGIEAGLIGDGVWEERPLTIAMIQTLHSRGMPTGYGMVLFDEAHHGGQAETWMKMVSNTNSRYLFGLTATPLQDDWRERILKVLFGDIILASSRSELRHKQVIMQPKINVVRTNFKWSPSKRERNLTNERTIYNKVISKLATDKNRNNKIVHRIAQQSGTTQIVSSRRLEQLHDIYEISCQHSDLDKDRLYLMTGNENRHQREEIRNIVAQGNCVLFTTVGGEGLDCPRLDRLHMVWPMRRALSVKQQLGRVERYHPAKDEVIALDYFDSNEPWLRGQFFARMKNVYKPGHYVVEGDYENN